MGTKGSVELICESAVGGRWGVGGCLCRREDQGTLSSSSGHEFSISSQDAERAMAGSLLVQARTGR